MQPPLRILHLTHASDAGGLSRYILDLSLACRARGLDVAVAGDRGAWHDRFEAAGLPYHVVPLNRGVVGFLAAARSLRRRLAEQPVDVLHSHYRRATLLGRRLQAGKAPPLLYTLHLSHISLAGPRRWLTDFGDHTHAASEDARRWLLDAGRVPPGRISLIPHGLDPSRFTPATPGQRAEARKALNVPPDARLGVYVGRLDYPKNEHWLLDVAQAARGKVPNLHLLLVGEGPNHARLAKQVLDRGLDKSVRLTGPLDVSGVYHAADALLLPSLREGFSYVCCEAMAAGVPCLRTRTSGTAEMIVENVTGRSTPIDHDAFVAAAVEFLADEPALRRMGHAAADHVRAHLTFDRQVAETVALYETLAGRR
ncbi:MAG: glycosyltransferase family 4 protein [Phycisphaerae bacterium]